MKDSSYLNSIVASLLNPKLQISLSHSTLGVFLSSPILTLFLFLFLLLFFSSPETSAYTPTFGSSHSVQLPETLTLYIQSQNEFRDHRSLFRRRVGRAL